MQICNQKTKEIKLNEKYQSNPLSNDKNNQTI